ncbi:AraC family transcriptional regulator [Roseomonas marmotae]|uniref:AraC family transcriptional regulator n=1 Tax=Roseomonas marmotae TaxID=2768161 RepID=A0ABS3K761_9PROT|nr:AraC family transcriptional regulator [Roseomonas marmotae]MBO1073275.1 AraC family transcriptional regulator [Roseomonas marmotae]QTI79105.1 AraC family transcriptional regulator [Roseomonas marmotae]
MSDLPSLTALMLRHTADDGVHATPIPSLWLIRMAHPTEPLHTLHEPAVCVIVQGAKQVALGEHIYAYDSAKYLMVSTDLPVVGTVVEASAATPYLCLRIDLDPAILVSLMEEAGIRQPPAGAPGPGLFLSPTTPEILEAVFRLARLLDQPRDIPVLAPLALRELHYRLLTGAQGEAARHLTATGGALRQVNRAIAWLKRHYRAPIRIARLADEVGMSPSALHHAFKAITAMSPLQYQKQLRLQEARRLMVARALDAASASYEVGYESPSQFTREYKRLFGAPPARDVARLRGMDASLTGPV